MKTVKNRIRSIDSLEKRELKKLGQRICEYAAKRKKSIERLAYEAGISKGYLYDIAKGIGNPSALILFRIASALNIPVSQLFIE